MNPKLMKLVLVLVCTVGLSLAGLVTAVDAEAASCGSIGNERWISSGCCGCNNVQMKEQVCTSVGWQNTGDTVCDYGRCCGYPCCV